MMLDCIAMKQWSSRARFVAFATIRHLFPSRNIHNANRLAIPPHSGEIVVAGTMPLGLINSRHYCPSRNLTILLLSAARSQWKLVYWESIMIIGVMLGYQQQGYRGFLDLLLVVFNWSQFLGVYHDYGKGTGESYSCRARGCDGTVLVTWLLKRQNAAAVPAGSLVAFSPKQRGRNTDSNI